jgi:hypothetical protein
MTPVAKKTATHTMTALHYGWLPFVITYGPYT